MHPGAKPLISQIVGAQAVAVAQQIGLAVQRQRVRVGQQGDAAVAGEARAQ